MVSFSPRELVFHTQNSYGLDMVPRRLTAMLMHSLIVRITNKEGSFFSTKKKVGGISYYNYKSNVKNDNGFSYNDDGDGSDDSNNYCD